MDKALVRELLCGATYAGFEPSNLSAAEEALKSAFNEISGIMRDTFVRALYHSQRTPR
jgi:hypothetical protein